MADRGARQDLRPEVEQYGECRLSLPWLGLRLGYFVVWWTALFVILPVRIRSQAEIGTDGTDPGAPDSPALYQRAVWTSIAAAIVFMLVAAFFPLAGL